MKTIIKKISTVLAFLFVVAVVPAGAQTEEDVKAEMKKDKTGTNPLNFTYDARLYNEYRWLNTAGDGHQNVTTVELRAPILDGKWQIRTRLYNVDMAADLNDDGMDDIDESGFGDMDIRLMTVPYMKAFAIGVGVELFLDTAEEDALGSGATTIAPLVGVGIFNPIGKGSIFLPLYQHKISVDEDSGRDRVHQGVLDLFLVKTFAGAKYWGFIDPQVILDYENSTEFVLMELQAGTMLRKKGQSVYAMPSVGLGNDRPYDFSLELAWKIVW